MALLGVDYASSDEEASSSRDQQRETLASAIVAAPEVSLDVWSYRSSR